MFANKGGSVEKIVFIWMGQNGFADLRDIVPGIALLKNIIFPCEDRSIDPQLPCFVVSNLVRLNKPQKLLRRINRELKGLTPDQTNALANRYGHLIGAAAKAAD